jgi:hypothetical protein
MIHLRLRPLVDDPTLPLYHPAKSRQARRFARIVTNAWRALPRAVTQEILDSWKYSTEDPAFVLVPSLPRRRSIFDGRKVQLPALMWQDGRLLVFSANWMRQRSDEQVEAAVIRELARIYRAETLGRDWWRGRHPDWRKARLLEEHATDKQVEEWGFAIRSVRRRQGRRQGSLGQRRRVRSHLGRRPKQTEAIRFSRRVRWLLNECKPHKSGKFAGTDIGYDPANHNANCRLTRDADGGTEPADKSKPGQRADGSSAGVNKVAGNNAAKTEKPANTAKKSPQAFRKEHLTQVNAAGSSSVKECCKVIKTVVEARANDNAPEFAAWECVVTVLTRGELQSQHKHGFDVLSVIARREVLAEAKHSGGAPGYYESAWPRISKVKESAARPNAVPAYILMAQGHGIYLHVGFDRQGIQSSSP